MAETLRTRVRRRVARRRPNPRQGSPRWSYGPYPQDPPSTPDDLDGGAGVREPRRPRPTAPADALALSEPEPQHLDLTH